MKSERISKGPIVTPVEVADYLQIPRKNQPRKNPSKYTTSESRSKTIAVVRLIEKGELEGLKVQGEWRVLWASVIAYKKRKELELKELLQRRIYRKEE